MEFECIIPQINTNNTDSKTIFDFFLKFLKDCFTTKLHSKYLFFTSKGNLMIFSVTRAIYYNETFNICNHFFNKHKIFIPLDGQTLSTALC